MTMAMKQILATDLDGTLIPLELTVPVDHSLQAAHLPNNAPRLGSDSSNRSLSRDRVNAAMDNDSNPLPTVDTADLRNSISQREALAILRQLSEKEILEIIFVTGRHQESVISVISAEGLPSPQWIICDVGTTILRRSQDQRYHPVDDYVNHLDRIVSSFSTLRLRQHIHPTADLELQEECKQGQFKLSFYCNAAKLEHHEVALKKSLARIQAPYQIISSIDPFNGDGLIDLLPDGTDKMSALVWWATFQQHPVEKIVFAGDSGNDYAALTAGFRCILVGNADRKLAARVFEHHRIKGTLDRFYLATGYATAGVLEGCHRFGLIDGLSRKDEV